MAEAVGFEPTCRVTDNRISSAARYDHFATLPCACKLYKKRRRRCKLCFCSSAFLSDLLFPYLNEYYGLVS